MRSRSAELAVVALVVAVGCATGDGMQEKLRDATSGYHGSVRWGDFDRAADYLPTESKQTFLDRHEKLEDKLVIVDYQMTRLDLDRETGVAGSRAEIMWHTDRHLVVKTTRIDQLWQFHEGRFVLVDERRSGGAPLAIYAEIGESPHPFLPGIDAYRKAHDIGKDNKKRKRRRRSNSATAHAAR